MSKRRTGDDGAGYELAPPPDVLPDADAVAEPHESPLAEIVREANAPPPAPAPSLPYVPLDVFCRTCGQKYDQTKGFARWARSQGLVALTIPEWREHWQKFQNRPVI